MSLSDDKTRERHILGIERGDKKKTHRFVSLHPLCPPRRQAGPGFQCYPCMHHGRGHCRIYCHHWKHCVFIALPASTTSNWSSIRLEPLVVIGEIKNGIKPSWNHKLSALFWVWSSDVIVCCSNGISSGSSENPWSSPQTCQMSCFTWLWLPQYLQHISCTIICTKTHVFVCFCMDTCTK